MSEDTKKPAPSPSDAPVETARLGKQYRGQKHAPIKTADDVRAEAIAQAPYSKPGAIPLDAYFARRGVRDPVMIAGMKAYTKVRHATYEDWNVIFANY